MGRFIEDIQQKQKLTKLGSPLWAAPQIMMPNEETYSAKADIYSVNYYIQYISSAPYFINYYSIIFHVET